MTILEDYGLTNPNSTRSLILKTIAEIEKGFPGVDATIANFKTISLKLWGNPNVMWENLHTVWRSERQRLATYWKSTDILQNLETLCDCGLIDGDEKDGYILTEEGQQAIRELQSLDNKATVGAKE